MTEPTLRFLEQLMAQGRAPDLPVATRAGAVLRWTQFERRAAAWRAAFRGQSGTRIALHCEDSFEFAAALFGAWHAGKALWLPANTLPDTLRRLRAQVDAVAGDDAFLAADRACGAAQLARVPVPADGLADDPADGVNAPGGWSPLDARIACVHVFTSGSTGEPLAIPKTLAQLTAEVSAHARRWDAALGCTGAATSFATVSHQHMFGFVFHVLWPLASGRPFTVERLHFAEDIARRIADSGAAILVSSPAHLKRLPEALPWEGARARLQAIFCAGGPLPDEALAGCQHLLGQAPVEIYGNSEAGALAWRRRDAAGPPYWQPLGDVAFRLVDEHLQARSAQFGSEDWQDTRDRARLHEQGYELLGRADRLLKVEEKRISLTAIERLLCASDLVEEVRVLCLPPAGPVGPAAASHRLRVGGVVVPSTAGRELLAAGGKSALNAALKACLAPAIEPVGLPRHWRYVAALPVDSQGKNSESRLAALFDPGLPRVLQVTRDGGTVTCTLDVPADCPHFAGHFDGFAMLPGVVQVDWAIHCAQQHFNLPPRFAALEALKFQHMILPDTTVALELALAGGGEASQAAQAAEAQCVVRFSYSSARGRCASGRIVFTS